MAEIAGTEFARELFAQRAWLGRLALSLVQDEGLAEDLVQETWIAAMRTQPAQDAGLRGWLATVMRNRARSKAREERNRKRREQWASRGEALPSTGEVVERAAIQQEVSDCVMRLPEPYRETVLLRFFDQLPPREIATRMQVPVATVKTRLARGLERLRELLDQTHGGNRSAWMGSVALLFAVPQKSWLGQGVGAAALLGLVVGGSWLALEWRSTPGVVEQEHAQLPELPRSERRAVQVVMAARSEPDQASKKQARSAAPATSRPAASTPNDTAREPKTLTKRERDARAVRRKTAFPSGLVSLPALRAKVGLEPDEVLLFESKLFEAKRSRGFAGLEGLDPRDSTPAHRREVDSFKLMNTEVTNEQYRRYVELSGDSSPLGWIPFADKAQIHRVGGRKDVEWVIPEDKLKHPVRGVGFRHAQAYAYRFGLRLPTEFEWERAVRGLSDDGYDRELQRRIASRGDVSLNTSSELGALNASFEPGIGPVGSAAKGKDKDPLFDLSGNVAEWVTSTGQPYSKEKRKDWSDELYPESIVRGGSFATPTVFAHAALRYPSPSAWREDVGFRCAAALAPGVDRMRALSRPESGDQAAKGEFDFTRILAIDHWIEEQSTSARETKAAKGLADVLLVGYEVALFAPLLVCTDAAQDANSRVQLGVYHHAFETEPSVALPKGTYRVWLQDGDSGNPMVELSADNGVRYFAEETVARLESRRGKHRLELGPAGRGRLRSLEFHASIPRPDGQWWNVQWNLSLASIVLEGPWRTEPWDERRNK